jgi:hypothetical protein
MRHQWIDMPKRKQDNKVHAFLLRWYPQASNSELDILLNQYTNDSFVDFVNSTGIPDEEANTVIKEYEKMNGKPTVKKGRKI